MRRGRRLTAGQEAADSRDLDVAIVGAGPYGLATAAHLRQRGLRVQVFGRVMEMWVDRMPHGMLLKSKGLATSIADPEGRLTLERFCAETGAAYADIGLPVSRELFTAYGQWFAERGAGEIEETYIQRLGRADGGYALDVDGRRIHAREVVVASGLIHFPFVPDELAGVPDGWVSHSSDYGALDVLRGRRVAVIGSGQSALELAVLLSESGAIPQLVARRPVLTWNGPPLTPGRPLGRILHPVSPLGGGALLWALSYGARFYRCLPAATRERFAWETLGPAGAWWLRERFASIPTVLGRRLSGAYVSDGALRLVLASADGQEEIEVDHAIAATGYRPDLASLPFLDAELAGSLKRMHSGLPRLDGAAESSARGLYFVGIMASPVFGPSMRFVTGTGVAARAVSRRILARIRPRLRPRADAQARPAERAA